MKTVFIVLADHSYRPFNLLTLSLILLISLASCSPAETVAPDTCECELTSGVVKDSASDGSTAAVKVDTCMEPRPCDPEDLEVTSFDEDSSQFTGEMKKELQDKGNVYALLDVRPDDKTWDPAITVEVVLNKPAPRDNFSLSILRWTASDWKKEGTAIAAKKDDLTARGKISHTSLFAFVDETDEEVVEHEDMPQPAEERVAIPDVVGMLQNEARQRLREEDLDVSLDRRPDADVDEGTVISTQPRAGREVESGTTVTLIVSTGSEEPDTVPVVEVPDLIGSPLEEAIQILSDHNLASGREIAVESSEPEGIVIETQPGPGAEVDIDTAVTLYYAVPEQLEPCMVPDLIGDPVDSAAGVLNDIGCLVAGQQIGVESPQAADDVIEMDPGPGTEVEAGTSVTLYYAIPEQSEQCFVPDVIGYYLDEAVDVLNNTGCLYAGEQIGVESSEYEWIVIDMSPGPAAEVGVDTAVTLYYAIPEQPELCLVPNVTGDHVDDAIAVLEETGCLNIGEIIEVESEYPYTEPYTVRYTDPEADTFVDIWTAVNLFIVEETDIEQDPVNDYNAGCDMGISAVEGYYAFSATILYDSNSAFSTDSMQGFSDCYSEMGGEIMNIIPLNSDWQTILVTSYAAGEQPDVVYFPVQAESASYIADVLTQLNEEFGLETVLFDAYGQR